MSARLERQQAEFAAALIDAAATTRLGRFLADPASAGERLRLYRSGIAATRLHALSSAYPVVRALVGAGILRGSVRCLCPANTRARAATSTCSVRASRQFVGGFASAASLPYLADVATLEWAVHRAYYAADAQPLPRERLATLTPAALLAQRFTLQPACVWLTSKFPIVTIWQAHQAGSGVALPEDIASRRDGAGRASALAGGGAPVEPCRDGGACRASRWCNDRNGHRGRHRGRAVFRLRRGARALAR